MGKRGTVVIPARIRKRLGMTDGCFLLLRENEHGCELQLARLEAQPADNRRALAASLLSNARDLGEYLAAIEEVRNLGLEPDDVPHERFATGKSGS